MPGERNECFLSSAQFREIERYFRQRERAEQKVREILDPFVTPPPHMYGRAIMAELEEEWWDV